MVALRDDEGDTMQGVEMGVGEWRGDTNEEFRISQVLDGVDSNATLRLTLFLALLQMVSISSKEP